MVEKEFVRVARVALLEDRALQAKADSERLGALRHNGLRQAPSKESEQEKLLLEEREAAAVQVDGLELWVAALATDPILEKAAADWATIWAQAKPDNAGATSNDPSGDGAGGGADAASEAAAADAGAAEKGRRSGRDFFFECPKGAARYRQGEQLLLKHEYAHARRRFEQASTETQVRPDLASYAWLT